MHAGESIRSVVVRLASRIREQGLDVYGMGMRKTPAAFVKACKRFIYVENLVPAVAASRRPVEKAVRVEDAAEKPADAEDPTKLVIRAMDAIAQDDEWYSLGQIGQYIMAANPDFDTRTYGKRKLSDLVADLKLFEMKKGPGQPEPRAADRLIYRPTPE
jgi:hypothetical protein